MKPSILMLLLAAAIPTHAVTANAQDLPPVEAVTRALYAHPDVLAARAGLRTAAGQRRQFEAGPHEFVVKIGAQRRRDLSLPRQYAEQDIALERALRMPGKAATDTELGAVAEEMADAAAGDALHETGRLLLRSWFDWLREREAARQWEAQRDILRRQADVAARRVELGDAAALDLHQAQAQLQQAEARYALAVDALARAVADFAQHFPSLPLPANIETTEPMTLDGSIDSWRERILEHNHELKLAATASRQRRLLVRRADADRVPDPTLGLQVSRERDGQEKVLGLSLSIPLPGSYRAAAVDVASGEAEATAAREGGIRARVDNEIRRAWRQMESTREQWRRLRDVAQRMDANADLLDKAWRLGEGQFGELQQARRQAIDARLAATQARLDANEARYRIMLDSHALWPLDGDEK